jgi:carboxymethylenebutenolidase
MRTLLVFIAAFCLSLPAQDWARDRLNKSPRHGEWVSIKHGDRTVEAFVVYPEVSHKTPVILVLHENQGLTDWAQNLADELAEAGYIAISPDLLSGMAPNGGRTTDFAPGTAVQGIGKLPPDQVTADLDAVAGYAKKIPACNGKIAVAGFCWGGGQSFRFATNRADLSAAFVFYGVGPDSKDAIAKIKAPVFGFYGGNDARVDATIPTSSGLMKEAGKTYDPITYEGAGHAFMRLGDAPDASGPNKKARDDAWERWKKLLANL